MIYCTCCPWHQTHTNMQTHVPLWSTQRFCKEYSCPQWINIALTFSEVLRVSLPVCQTGAKKNVSKTSDGFFDFLIDFISASQRFAAICICPSSSPEIPPSHWELILWNYECNNIYRVSNIRRWLCNYPTNLCSFIFCKLRAPGVISHTIQYPETWHLI